MKTILKAAQPRLLSALGSGTLTINKALMLCQLPRAEQLEAFTQLIEKRAIDKVIRETLARSRRQEPCGNPDTVLAAFQLCESRHPGSIVVSHSRSGRTTISVSDALLRIVLPQLELQTHERT